MKSWECKGSTPPMPTPFEIRPITPNEGIMVANRPANSWVFLVALPRVGPVDSHDEHFLASAAVVVLVGD